MSEWHRSSYSSGQGGECIEVKYGTDVLVRDSKNPEQPHLSFTADQWSAFVTAVKDGDRTRCAKNRSSLGVRPFSTPLRRDDPRTPPHHSTQGKIIIEHDQVSGAAGLQ
ncbi:DUF397 domain-containing protein [Allonocardiopsis opalescens]|uniref:Uncharacterized protein DUF397 n=1 Tax=Allonocardiopsis opalescens TaxID=1144618 RepID=A0A2T0QCH5_9ACTN|nr:DUF397 domain-containing protein [Allonocardiopsis opalescens]PRY01570.1 uncharacterized protein DUF397 [Allonocardiopsis opalescens]